MSCTKLFLCDFFKKSLCTTKFSCPKPLFVCVTVFIPQMRHIIAICSNATHILTRSFIILWFIVVGANEVSEFYFPFKKSLTGEADDFLY